MHFDHLEFLYCLENKLAPKFIPTFHKGSIPLKNYKYGITVVDTSGTSISSLNYNESESESEFIDSTPSNCTMIEPFCYSDYDNIVMTLCIESNKIYHFFVFSRKYHYFKSDISDWKIYQAFDFDGSVFSLVDNALFKEFGEKRIKTKELCEAIPFFENIPETSGIKYFFN